MKRLSRRQRRALAALGQQLVEQDPELAERRSDAGPGSAPEPGTPEPVDPDVDLQVPAQRRELAAPHGAAVLAAIAAGGIGGAEARYGLGLAWPHGASGWPWSTLAINVSGCLLIGVLTILITERFTPHPLLRPLLGVGMLGGYTTFSTFAVDVLTLATSGRLAAAAGCLVVTPVAALAAVWVGAATTRRLIGRTDRVEQAGPS